MLKVLISLATAASALAIAGPASAQYYPAPHGYAYGYHNNYGQVRRLEARVQQLRQQIHQLGRVNRLSNREARRLDWHAAALQHSVRVAASRGLSRNEKREIERRIESLRQAIRHQARDGSRRGWNGYNRNDNAYGYYAGRRDRDDDRWERDDDDDDNRGRRRGRDNDRDDDDD